MASLSRLSSVLCPQSSVCGLSAVSLPSRGRGIRGELARWADELPTQLIRPPRIKPPVAALVARQRGSVMILTSPDFDLESHCDCTYTHAQPARGSKAAHLGPGLPNRTLPGFSQPTVSLGARSGPINDKTLDCTKAGRVKAGPWLLWAARVRCLPPGQHRQC